jgi:hypothetical protein
MMYMDSINRIALKILSVRLEVRVSLSQRSQGQLEFRKLDRLMACRSVRLAAAGANAACQGAGNTYAWGLDMAKARR